MIFSPVEQTLVERVRQGEHRSFYKFIENYSSMAYRYALHLVQDPEKAYDICSAAFLRTFSLIKNPPSTRMPFRTWFYRIITCCYLESMRKNQHSKFKLKSILHSYQQKETLNVTKKISDNSLLMRISESLLTALNSLTDHQKIMVILSHSEKLESEEIAEILGLPINTLKRRLDHVHLLLAKHWVA